jgi:hypothetical protein
MCNVLDRLSAMAPFIQGRALHQLYPAQFIQNWPYHQVRPGCCINPVCRRQMFHEEMFPSDEKTPRAMCPECYAEWTYTVTEKCPVCGDYLENWRVSNQIHQPHEVIFRLHDGICLDYFSLLSGKALGQCSGIIDEACAHGYPQLQQGYVEGHYKKNGHRGEDFPPLRRVRFGVQQAGTYEFVPQRSVKTTYKGKEVKVIRKERHQGR